MPDKKELIEQVTAKLRQQIETAYALGLTRFELHHIMIAINRELDLKADAAYWLNKVEKER